MNRTKILFISAFLLCGVKLNAQSLNRVSFRLADSFYFSNEWSKAIHLYEQLLNDTSKNSVEWQRLAFSHYSLGNIDDALKYYAKSETTNPPTAMLPFLYSRMSKAYAIKNNGEKTIAYLKKAIDAGYVNYKELDTSKEFSSFQQNENFKQMKTAVYNRLYPCYGNAHAREFDFWVGEWDVFATGTKTLVGHSLIQLISGGCALLENWEGGNSSGKSINFIDPNTNKWKQSWAGSYANGVQEFVNGEYRDSAMRFEYETTNTNGNKLKGRFIFYNQEPNQVRQFNEASADGGKTWTTNYDFTYIRKK